jgi:hypothetical protein
MGRLLGLWIFDDYWCDLPVESCGRISKFNMLTGNYEGAYESPDDLDHAKISFVRF